MSIRFSNGNGSGMYWLHPKINAKIVRKDIQISRYSQTTNHKHKGSQIGRNKIKEIWIELRVERWELAGIIIIMNAFIFYKQKYFAERIAKSLLSYELIQSSVATNPDFQCFYRTFLHSDFNMHLCIQVSTRLCSKSEVYHCFYCTWTLDWVFISAV